ncbi:MAG: IS3 family transposase [Bacteroidetes bacterium]|nr:IS3 family transposase [Bacteroidota bacterium]
MVRGVCSSIFMREGISINIKRIRRLMHKIGIIAIYPKKKTTLANVLHKKYPYLLRDLKIEWVNQVWSIDITYVPMKNGYMYLTAVMDWYSRKVLNWKISASMTVDFCRNCLQEAINTFGTPEIFNSDQGCQFTSVKFTSIWNGTQTKISMDGRGRAIDNVFIERLWRSVKYENIFISAYETNSDLYAGLFEYFHFYNSGRFHQSLNYKTPDEIYYMNMLTDMNKEKKSKKEIQHHQQK